MISCGSLSPGEHVGVGHARHGQVGVGLAPAVAGGGDAHEAGVELVLHVSAQDAVLDQHRALGRRALVVHVQRAATVGQGAVVDDGDAGGRDPFAHASGEGGGALAVEVALQAVAHRLVQQHARPAGAEHHGHGAGGSVRGLQVGQCEAHRLAGEAERPVLLDEVVEAPPGAAAARALLAAVSVLGDDADVQAHQGPHVGGQGAVVGHHQHQVMGGHQTGDNLLHARVLAPGLLVDPVQQGDLVRVRAGSPAG